MSLLGWAFEPLWSSWAKDRPFWLSWLPPPPGQQSRLRPLGSSFSGGRWCWRLTATFLFSSSSAPLQVSGRELLWLQWPSNSRELSWFHHISHWQGRPW